MSRAPAHSFAAGRFYTVLVALGLLAVVLSGWMLSLLVVEQEHGREFLKQQGDKRAVRQTEIPAFRGLISDRRGEPLAVSTPVMSLYVDPVELQQAGEVAELAAALDVDQAELEARLQAYEGKRFMYLRRHEEPQRAREVMARGIAGVNIQREYRRFYPPKEVAAQLVGMTGLEGNGLFGLEKAYDRLLAGKPGTRKYLKDLTGKRVRDIGVVEPAESGRDIALSIDLRLQAHQHNVLRRAVVALHAESGTAVTLDSRTGEVLAMVSYPDFNPNEPLSSDVAGMRNRAMSDFYEPGSTMKALTLVAALESGRYTLDTVIDTTPGYVSAGRKTYRDPRNYGPISLSRVIEKSSQVGVTRIALDLGHEPIWDVFRRFGIGQPLGTGFPSEKSGELPNRRRWHVTEEVSLAFGYGITATPLQLAHAYAALANDGVAVPVSLLALEGEPPEGTRIVSSKVAAQVLQALHAVTGEHGTGRRARVPGYEVGGKTGTVHKAVVGGYAEHRYVALFAGIAPIDNPRFVTVVVIDEPRGEEYGGGAAAAPVFSAIAEGALRLLNIAPTEPVEAVVSGGKAPGGAA